MGEQGKDVCERSTKASWNFMTPLQSCPSFRSTHQSIFWTRFTAVFQVNTCFQPSFWIPCSTDSSLQVTCLNLSPFLSSFAALLYPLAVPHDSLFSLCIPLFSFIFRFSSFLFSSFLPFHLHAHTLCQPWHNVWTKLMSLSHSPLSFNGSTFKLIRNTIGNRKTEIVHEVVWCDEQIRWRIGQIMTWLVGKEW